MCAYLVLVLQEYRRIICIENMCSIENRKAYTRSVCVTVRGGVRWFPSQVVTRELHRFHLESFRMEATTRRLPV